MDAFLENFDVFTYIVMPILIMLARMCDVSIGTMRVIFVSKGYRKLAAFLGFIELLLWLVVGRQVLVKSDNVLHFIAYAAGFGLGNYIGMMIEDKMSIGIVMMRIILRENNTDLLNFLKEHDFGYTVVNGYGAKSEVKVLFSVIQREDVPEILQAIEKFNPKAFYSIEDVRTARAGIFPQKIGKHRLLFRNGRKAK